MTLRNGTGFPVRATGWGLKLPGEVRIIAPVHATGWEPQLPHWVATGDAATWYFEAAELRRHSAERLLAFDSMLAYVSLADGRTVLASNGVPLS